MRYKDSPSIMQTEKCCYISGSTVNLERHHIFESANRRNSAKYGLWVYLRHDLHNEPPYGAHHNAQTAYRLKQDAQRKFEETHGRDEFMKIFGRNYL